MNNETQPTPEQLTQWREEFEDKYSKSELPWRDTATNKYRNFELQKVWEIYLPLKQETHQEITQLKADIVNALRAVTDQAVATKDVRKQVSQEVLEIFHRTYPSDKAQLFAIMEFINDQ